MSDSSSSRKIVSGKAIAIAAVVIVGLAGGWALLSQKNGSADQGDVLPNRFADIEYPNAVAGEWRSGEQIYAGTCNYCHSVPTVAPVILGRSLPPEFVTPIVRHGQNGMPAFRQTDISDEQLALLTAFLQSSAAPSQVAPHGAAQPEAAGQ